MRHEQLEKNLGQQQMEDIAPPLLIASPASSNALSARPTKAKATTTLQMLQTPYVIAPAAGFVTVIAAALLYPSLLYDKNDALSYQTITLIFAGVALAVFFSPNIQEYIKSKAA